jgi:hypothetical protein
MTKTIAKTKKPAAKQKSSSTCKFAFSDARSCAMPRWRKHRMYCLFHARQEQQLIDADQLGQELATFTGEFRTSTDLNRALGNLFKAVAHNRIPPRNAAVLAYIGQLLQQNISDVQYEITRIEGSEGLKDVLRQALDAHDGRTEEPDDEDEEDDDEETDTDPDDESDGDDDDSDGDGDEAEAEATNNASKVAAQKSPTHRFHPNHAGGIRVPIADAPPETPPAPPAGQG